MYVYAFGENGKISDEDKIEVEFSSGLVIKPKKNFLYIVHPKAHSLSSKYYSFPHIGLFSSGELNIFGVDIVVEPFSGVSEGFDCQKALFYAQERCLGEDKHFAGITSYGLITEADKLRFVSFLLERDENNPWVASVVKKVLEEVKV